ncbi:MAG: hypothetical protein CMM28_01460 [Rhodospirillaceae bacterium]|nr:hypothetical protein [Rhodospirillaceae bacterium]
MRLLGFLLKKASSVKGIYLPGPRFTRWAWIYFVAYVAAPILAIGLVSDLVLYYIFDQWFGACYALLCLFD